VIVVAPAPPAMEGGNAMEKETRSFEGIGGIVSQALEQTRSAMDAYFGIVQKGMSAAPKVNLTVDTGLFEKVKSFTDQNMAAATELSQRLLQAKDLPEIVKLHTDFMQAQFKLFAEQAKEIGETATRTATDTMMKPFNSSS
jgi:hypothetical protein